MDLPTFPAFHKNFFCNDEGGQLANQFIEHYFTLYDSHDREALVSLYDKDALIAVRSSIIPSQITSTSVK